MIPSDLIEANNGIWNYIDSPPFYTCVVTLSFKTNCTSIKVYSVDTFSDNLCASRDLCRSNKWIEQFFLPQDTATRIRFFVVCSFCNESALI